MMYPVRTKCADQLCGPTVIMVQVCGSIRDRDLGLIFQISGFGIDIKDFGVRDVNLGFRDLDLGSEFLNGPSIEGTFCKIFQKGFFFTFSLN